MVRATLAVSAAALMLLIAPSAVLAADKADVEVFSIRGTSKNSEISPQLRSLADTLRKAVKHTGFTLANTTRQSVELGKSANCPAPGGYSAVVTPLKRDGQKVQVQVEVLRKEGGKDVSKLKSTITIVGGKHQLFTGFPLDGGDSLILAVSAK